MDAVSYLDLSFSQVAHMPKGSKSPMPMTVTNLIDHLTVIIAIAFGAISAVAQDAPPDEAAALAKKLQNPVASLISVPFQNNFDFNLGPSEDGWRYTLNIQPVIPVSLNKDWNVIVRTILPFVHQEDAFKGNGRVIEEDIDGLPIEVMQGARPPGRVQDGLSDTVQSFFFSPKEPVGGLILAFGPVLLYPTATDSLLGSEKWGAGPTGLVLKQSGGWTYGMLFNQIWSFAGDEDRRSVNATFLQPFLSYTTKTRTTFGVNTESTYNWNTEQWNVPINVSISQVLKVGKQPISVALGGRYYADGPNGAPQWGMRATVTLLFPTGGKPAAQPPPSAK